VVSYDFVVRPVRRNRVSCVGQLKAFDDPQDLVHVSAKLHRVVEYCSYDSFRVCYEYSSDCLSSFCLFVAHAQFGRNIAGVVSNYGELDFDADLLFDPFLPLQVGKDLVDA
jgi:hypothetical protein